MCVMPWPTLIDNEWKTHLRDAYQLIYMVNVTISISNQSHLQS